MQQLPSPETNPCLWVPEEPFIVQNQKPIQGIFETIRREFPDSGVEVVLDALPEFTPEARQWMWVKLMGAQHGSQLGFGGKLQLGRGSPQEAALRPHVNELAYGDL